MSGKKSKKTEFNVDFDGGNFAQFDYENGLIFFFGTDFKLSFDELMLLNEVYHENENLL